MVQKVCEYTIVYINTNIFMDERSRMFCSIRVGW